MNTIFKLAILAGIGKLALRQPTLCVGTRVRIQGQHAHWDGATGVITEHHGKSCTVAMVDTNKYGPRACFRLEKLEVI